MTSRAHRQPAIMSGPSRAVRALFAFAAAMCLVWPGPARASEGSPAPAPKQALAPAPTVPSTGSEDIGQQLGALQQRLAVVEARLAAVQKPAPTVNAEDGNFGLRSADGANSIRFRGVLQVDTRWFLDDGVLSDKSDTFLIRRMRPSMDGTLFGLADYRFVPDFAGGQAAVFDAYVDIHPVGWARLRVGKFKPPIGLERLQQDPNLALPERALTQALTPARDVGVSLWGETPCGLLTYNLGIFNGASDGANSDLDSNHAKDFAARILIQPLRRESLKGLGALGIHFAATTGNRRGLPTSPQLPSYKSAGQSTFFAYLAPATDPSGTGTAFAHLRQSRLNPGAFYYYGPIGLLGEYVWSRQRVQKGNAQVNLTHQAAHVTVSYVIGGKNGYDGATPNARFNLTQRTWGALEIAARWNWLKLDNAVFGNPADPTAVAFADPSKSASKAQGFAGSVNFIPSRTLRLSVAFEQTRFEGGRVAADKKAIVDRNTENVIFGRTQVNF
jgi:phosphate-selective porin OprO and OprP